MLTEQLKIARARSAAIRAIVPTAIAATYDSDADTILVNLSNGITKSISRESIAGLPDEVHQVSVTPSGFGLRWEELDLDWSIEDLCWESISHD